MVTCVSTLRMFIRVFFFLKKLEAIGKRFNENVRRMIDKKTIKRGEVKYHVVYFTA